MRKAKVFSIIIIPVLVSAFLIGGTTQETKAASTYSTTETYYGAGYYYQDSSYNMQMQANFGGTGASLNTVVSGYTSVKSTTSTSSDVVSIISNSYPSATDAINRTNGLGGYGSGGSASVSIQYSPRSSAYALYGSHTNVTRGREHDVYLFYKVNDN